MNLGKCATCAYVNESATAMCSRADCALSADQAAANEALKCGATLPETAYMVAMRCSLAANHSGDHAAGMVRWSEQ